jgi:hypothetical protein
MLQMVIVYYALILVQPVQFLELVSLVNHLFQLIQHQMDLVILVIIKTVLIAQFQILSFVNNVIQIMQ